jgi:heme A synthase
MSIVVNTILVTVQTILGILILLRTADIRTLAWYYVISGAVTLTLLVAAGVVKLNERQK